jgi:hypothetical protein
MAQDSFFSKLFAFRFQWVAKLFHNSRKNFLQAAIDITNVVKTAVNSKIVDFITSVIPGTVDNSIVAILRDQVPKILADELLIQATGAPATEADAQALAQKLIDSFGSLSDVNKEKFFTSVAAKIYIFLQAHDNGQKVTFGEAATLAESFYQEWLADQTTN